MNTRISRFDFNCGAVEVEARNGFNGNELGWSGCVVGVATFNQHQEKRYHELQQHYKIIGQSFPVKNPNSGNWIFAVVFTNKYLKVLNENS